MFTFYAVTNSKVNRDVCGKDVKIRCETISRVVHGICFLDGAPRGFIQVNNGKKFDPIKTSTLTGTFKIFIAAWVDPGISLLSYPF